MNFQIKHILAYTFIVFLALSCKQNTSDINAAKADSTQTAKMKSDISSGKSAATKRFGAPGKISDTAACNCNDISPETEDGEILHYICTYIQDNNITTTESPCTIAILSKTIKTQQRKEVYEIRLSCCYAGDVVIMDRKTLEVLEYQAADL